jgi:phosphate transport system protein
MMRSRFHQGLDELKGKLLAMGGLVENAMDLAIRAHRERDLNLCQKVLDGETDINLAERQIDELAFDLLAMQQPMAVDLRFILAVIKINADLERVGDQAVNIAQRVMDLVALPPADLPADIPHMAAIATAMVRHALEAFISGDANLAQRVLENDDEVDRLNREVFTAMFASMRQSPDHIRQALDTIIIARNLERVADHATNIAEDVIFWTRGADVRHHFGSFPVRNS